MFGGRLLSAFVTAARLGGSCSRCSLLTDLAPPLPFVLLSAPPSHMCRVFSTLGQHWRPELHTSCRFNSHREDHGAAGGAGPKEQLRAACQAAPHTRPGPGSQGGAGLRGPRRGDWDPEALSSPSPSCPRRRLRTGLRSRPGAQTPFPGPSPQTWTWASPRSSDRPSHKEPSTTGPRAAIAYQ